MQCYHPSFHLQQSKNVVMFLIFVYCFYFCCIPVCWLVLMCICFLSLLSICLLSILCPFLAEARLSVGGWSVAPLARGRDTGNGHVHSSCKTVQASVTVPVSEGLWGRNFCGLPMSLQCHRLLYPIPLLWTLASWQKSRPLQLHSVESPWLIEKPLVLASLSLVSLTSSGNFDFTVCFVAVRIVH